jgi:hypothetical protein
LLGSIPNFTLSQNIVSGATPPYYIPIDFQNIPSSSNDINNTFGLYTLKFLRNIYGTPVAASSDSIDQIQYTLVDPMYTKDGNSGNSDPAGDTNKQSSSFLFKTFKIN